MLFIALPSGRKLTYVRPRMGVNKFGGEPVTYEEVGSAKKMGALKAMVQSLWKISCRP